MEKSAPAQYVGFHRGGKAVLRGFVAGTYSLTFRKGVDYTLGSLNMENANLMCRWHCNLLLVCETYSVDAKQLGEQWWIKSTSKYQPE